MVCIFGDSSSPPPGPWKGGGRPFFILQSVGQWSTSGVPLSQPLNTIKSINFCWKKEEI